MAPFSHRSHRCQQEHSRRGERGASLLLSLLVLMVLLVVVAQVKYMAVVEMDHVAAYVEGTRYRRLAEAAVQDAVATLLMDVERDATGGDTAEGIEEEEAASEDLTASTDSKLDEWAHSESLIPVMGGDLHIVVEVVDEDRKINLLGMFAEDESERERRREMLMRLLDEVFEGTSNDFGIPEADFVLSGLEDWVEGNRGYVDPVPTPVLKKTNAQDELQEEPSSFEDEQHLPLTLLELSMLEGVAPVHLYGFVEEEVFFPGLLEYLTIWTHLELKPEPVEEDPFAQSPFEVADAEEEEGGTSEEGTTANPTNDGLVNLNTAPLAVLRAMAADEIPTSYLEKIVEFRKKIDEYEALGEEASFLLNSFGGGSDTATAGEEGSESMVEEEDEDITRFVFEDPNNLWEKIQDEFGIEPTFDSPIQNDFTSLFTTSSQVFTIRVLIAEHMPDEEESGAPIRRQSFRTVVWRMGSSEGHAMVTLRPLQPYWDPRRMAVDYGLDPEEYEEAQRQAMEDDYWNG